MAALNAASEIKTRMSAVAAEHFEVPVDEIEFSANRISPSRCAPSSQPNAIGG